MNLRYVITEISKYGQAAVGAVYCFGIGAIATVAMTAFIARPSNWYPVPDFLFPVFATVGGAFCAFAWARHTLNRFKLPDLSACRACGYSLTGNVSGICPECGTKVEVGA